MDYFPPITKECLCYTRRKNMVFTKLEAGGCHQSGTHQVCDATLLRRPNMWTSRRCHDAFATAEYMDVAKLTRCFCDGQVCGRHEDFTTLYPVSSMFSLTISSVLELKLPNRNSTGKLYVVYVATGQQTVPGYVDNNYNQKLH